MATLQVKGMDDRLYEALRRRAARDNRSISQEVIALLRDHLSRPRPQNRGTATDEFLELAGTWQDDRSAPEIAAEIRGSRHTKRRFSEGTL